MFGRFQRVYWDAASTLLESHVMRPALSASTRERVVLWCRVCGARVELHQNLLATPVIGLAVPPVVESESNDEAVAVAAERTPPADWIEPAPVFVA